MFAGPLKAAKSSFFSVPASSASFDASLSDAFSTTPPTISGGITSMQDAPAPITWNHRASSGSANISSYDREHGSPTNYPAALIPRSIPPVPGVDLTSAAPSSARLFPIPPSTAASNASSNMSSFYPADFSHSAPGSASGSSGNSYPSRAGLDGSRPYTMAGYLASSGSSAPANSSGAAGPASNAGPGPSTGPYHAEYGAPYPSGNAGTGSTTSGMLTGYRPASSHETFSGSTSYNYPSSRSSFSTYGPGSSTYGSTPVGSSSSAPGPYHHGAYTHSASYGAPPASSGSSAPGTASDYPSYPAQGGSAGSDAPATYSSGVPGYAGAGAVGYTYNSSQTGIYPSSHAGVPVSSGPVPSGQAAGQYAFSHGSGQTIHYLNPFEVKHRRRTTKQQFRVLEGTFKENPKPNAAVRKALAAQLDMPGRAVQIWFQNRRAKAKAQAKKEEQATRERAATAEGSAGGSAGKGQQQQGGGQGGHARSVTAPQPSSSANTSTDSYSSRPSPNQGDYRHPQLPPPQGPYGAPGQMHGHHGPSHHLSGGASGWHSGHPSSAR